MDMCKSGATPTFSTHFSGNEPALLKEQDRSRESGGSSILTLYVSWVYDAS